MQTFEKLLLQTCTFTKGKLILSNNEDNNNKIGINKIKIIIKIITILSLLLISILEFVSPS